VFEGFTLDRIDTGEVELRVRYGGSGPPVVLLHGHPRTHTTWHWVAPALAHNHTIVCPDLRSDGGSGKPASTDDHTPYSKRSMAADVIVLMGVLGHDRFAVSRPVVMRACPRPDRRRRPSTPHRVRRC
jgi:haloacetate dehalogenase